MTYPQFDARIFCRKIPLPEKNMQQEDDLPGLGQTLTGKRPVGEAPSVRELFGKQVTEDFRTETCEAFGRAGEGFVRRHTVG